MKALRFGTAGLQLLIGIGSVILSALILAPLLLLKLGGALVAASLVGFLIGGVLNLLIFELQAKSPFEDLRQLAVVIGVIVIFWVVVIQQLALETWEKLKGPTLNSHGSARFASAKELLGFEGGSGLLIGRNPVTRKLLRYDGPAHLLTFAPTRAGKGVGTVIPNLLMLKRSVLVIDPKGENARITGKARERFGPVYVLDPFEVTGRPAAAYNPLGRLRPDSLDLGEEASALAEALVVDAPGQSGDAHWNEEAKALLAGLIMFCVAHEPPQRRTLSSVREYLTLPPERLRALFELMQDSDAAAGLIARAANRFLGKADREAASVLSSAQRHTHFLDSPRIAKVTARSDFEFADLRYQLASVFLVLPPNRLDAYSRWLRLLVSQALQDIAQAAEGATAPSTTEDSPQGPEAATRAVQGRAAASKPLQDPTLFLLDEFAALGRLQAIERAMGLMAGYGLQLWPILQDMSQLKDLYGARANTFVANAGVQQVFGVNDFETAKWLSQMMGKETTQFETESQRGQEDASISKNVTGRDLMTPDEIMQLPPDQQLLRIQGHPTARVQKLRYFSDPEFANLFPKQDP